MTQVIIPETSIERIYPSENDVGNGPYNGVRGTEPNIARQVGTSMFNGIISNVDGNGISLGIGGFEIINYSDDSLIVTFSLGRANINGYFINCVSTNTIPLSLDADKTLYVYLTLVKTGGIVNEGFDPDGALKIVASETPVALRGFVPLYILQTSDVGILNIDDKIQTSQILDMREHALRTPLTDHFVRPAWDGGCVISGFVQTESAIANPPLTIDTKIHNARNADDIDFENSPIWFKHTFGEPIYCTVIRSGILTTATFPATWDYPGRFRFKVAGDFVSELPYPPSTPSGIADNNWIISDW